MFTHRLIKTTVCMANVIFFLSTAEGEFFFFFFPFPTKPSPALKGVSNSFTKEERREFVISLVLTAFPMNVLRTGNKSQLSGLGGYLSFDGGAAGLLGQRHQSDGPKC